MKVPIADALFVTAVFSVSHRNPFSTAIKINCWKDSVNITWRISQELTPYSTRLFLGNCIRSSVTTLPLGDWELHFDYKFKDCKFTRKVNRWRRRSPEFSIACWWPACPSQMKGKHLIHQNVLTYRPGAKSKPPVYEYFFECVQRRCSIFGCPPFSWSLFKTFSTLFLGQKGGFLHSSTRPPVFLQGVVASSSIWRS